MMRRKAQARRMPRAVLQLWIGDHAVQGTVLVVRLGRVMHPRASSCARVRCGALCTCVAFDKLKRPMECPRTRCGLGAPHLYVTILHAHTRPMQVWRIAPGHMHRVWWARCLHMRQPQRYQFTLEEANPDFTNSLRANHP